MVSRGPRVRMWQLILLFITPSALLSQTASTSPNFCEVGIAVTGHVAANGSSLATTEQRVLSRQIQLLQSFQVQDYVRRTCDEACAHFGNGPPEDVADIAAEASVSLESSGSYRCAAACDTTTSSSCECDESAFDSSLCSKKLGSKICGCALEHNLSDSFPSLQASIDILHATVEPNDVLFASEIATVLRQNPGHPVYDALMRKSLAVVEALPRGATAKLHEAPQLGGAIATAAFVRRPLPRPENIVEEVRGQRKSRQVTALDILALHGIGSVNGEKVGKGSVATCPRRSHVSHDFFGPHLTAKQTKHGSDSDGGPNSGLATTAKPFLQVPLLPSDPNNPWFEPQTGKFELDRPGKCHGPLCFEHVSDGALDASGNIGMDNSPRIHEFADKAQSSAGSGPSLDFEVLSEEPRVFYYPNFLSEEEVMVEMHANEEGHLHFVTCRNILLKFCVFPRCSMQLDRYAALGMNGTGLSKRKYGENNFWKRCVCNAFFSTD